MPISTALSAQFAAYLLGELKLKKGDRVAIMMPNCLQYPIATFGILRAGLTVVNVNPMYTPRELQAPAGRFRRRARSWCSTTSATPCRK